MTEPMEGGNEIDVIETGVDQADDYGPDIGRPDYWIDETMEYTGDSVFSLEEGNYEMDTVELDRNLRSISQRAYMTPAKGGAVFFAEGEFMYVNIEDLDQDDGEASLNVRKGSYEKFLCQTETLAPQEQIQELSEGFFERIIDQEVEMDPDELIRQRRAR